MSDRLDDAQEIPAIRPGETKEEWEERLSNIRNNKGMVTVFVQVPRPLYNAYAKLNRLSQAYQIQQSFERVVNRAMEMKLEEFSLMVQAVEAEYKASGGRATDETTRSSD